MYDIIYILGVVATVLLLYCGLEHERKITVTDVTLALLISLFSWLGFVIALIVFFGDYVVFTKK